MFSGAEPGRDIHFTVDVDNWFIYRAAVQNKTVFVYRSRFFAVVRKETMFSIEPTSVWDELTVCQTKRDPGV